MIGFLVNVLLSLNFSSPRGDEKSAWCAFTSFTRRKRNVVCQGAGGTLLREIVVN
jgi:hypothetical protein